MTTSEILAAAQALLLNPYAAGAIGSIIIVAVGARLYRMLLFAGSAPYKWEDDYADYEEYGHSSQEEHEAWVNSYGVDRYYRGD